jgi:hypothetical protein
LKVDAASRKATQASTFPIDRASVWLYISTHPRATGDTMRDVVDHIIGIAIGGILFYGPFWLFLH